MIPRLLPIFLAAFLAGDGPGPVPADPPPRIPADFDPTGIPVTDWLASWVPADASAAFFESLDAAETQVGELAEALPRAFPDLLGDPPEGARDALTRATEMLLLPPTWRANPGVRTGTRQVALVASDLELRRTPDIALVCEVDDATLVRTHRVATFSWEDRSPRRLVVEGLDARTEDGSVRSFFALEGGVAVWSTSRSLSDRILAAGAGKAPSLLRPDARAWALARKTFPAAEGGALLVVPDAFLARIRAAPGAVVPCPLPVAARCRGRTLEVLVPPGDAGKALRGKWKDLPAGSVEAR